MIRSFAVVLVLASASGAMAQGVSPYSSRQTLEAHVYPDGTPAPPDMRLASPDGAMVSPQSDLGRAKAVCDQHLVWHEDMDIMRMDMKTGRRVQPVVSSAAPGWKACNRIIARWKQVEADAAKTAVAKATAAAAEQERQDHALVDRVAAGK